MKKYIEKVKTLMESFPYIQEFWGKTIVIKYGGSAMADEELKMSFAKDVVLCKYVGINPVIVHGGGPQIGEALKKKGIKTEFIDGLRVTDSETMDIVESVLVGSVNKEIVENINSAGGRAVGLSGRNEGFLVAEKLQHSTGGKEVDLGQVGFIKDVDATVVKKMDTDRFIPVIAPVGVDKKGVAYNINADIAAGKIAESLGALKFILLTDVPGVMIDDELASSLKKNEISSLIKKEQISGGMIPKVNCCLKALNGGVNKTHIIDGRVEHALLLEIFTDAGIGTEII